MRKTQIIKWLEKLKAEKKQACVEAYYAKQKEIETKIYKENGTEDIARIIHEHIVEIGKQIDNWKKRLDERVTVTGYCSSIGYFVAQLSTYDDVYKRLTSTDTYISLTGELGDAQRKKDKMVEEIRQAYDSVIANVRALPTAKKGIEYLKELGFDVSELEKMDDQKTAVSTALATPIDTRYLFLGDESDS